MAQRIKDEEIRLKVSIDASSGTKELDELRKSSKLNTMTIADLNKTAKRLRLSLAGLDPNTKEFKEYNKALRSVNTRLKELRSGSAKTSGIFSKLGKAAMGVVAMFQIASKAIRTIANAVSAVVSKIADFEQANANLATILGKGINEIGMLTDAAQTLGRTTEYTASQVTLLQTELAKLGFNEGQILAMEKPVLQFATAVGADLPEAASFAGAALRIFNLKASDAEDTLASFAIATNKSALSFSYLQEAMSIVGPVAQTFGFGVKDTTALLGVLANSGFDASSAATATRNILLNLADANGKLAKALDGPVKTFPELIDALAKLKAKGVDLNSTLQMTDKRSVAAFNTLLSGADSAMELRDALNETNGELQRISDERLNTVSGSIKTLQSAWEGFMLSMSGSKGLIKGIIDLTTKAVNKLTLLLFRGARVNAASDEMVTEFQNYYKDNGNNEEELDKYIQERIAKAEEEVRIAKENIQKAIAEIAAGDESVVPDQRALSKAKEQLEALNKAAEKVKTLIENDKIETQITIDGSPTNNNFDLDDKWSLEKDEKFLAQKKKLLEDYNNGIIASQAEYESQLSQLEIQALEKRLAAVKGNAKESSDIEVQILEKRKQLADKQRSNQEKSESLRIQAMAEGVDKQLALENQRYEQEKKTLAGNNAALEAAEAVHRKNLLKIYIDNESGLLDKMEKTASLEKQRIELTYIERLAAVRKGSAEESALRKQMSAELLSVDLENLQESKTLLEKIVNDAAINGMELSDEELASFRSQLNEIIKKIAQIQGSLFDPSWKDGTSNGSFMGVSQAEWDSFFENLKKGKFGAEDLEAAIRAAGGASQEAFGLADQAIAMIEARENDALETSKKNNEKKQDDLQKRLDAGLMTQSQYDAEIARLQEEQDAASEELSLKQAERQKRFSIVQAIINTALGVTKTLAEWGVPAGLVPARIMAAMGAAQVALMAATPVSGREKGGMVNVKRSQDGKRFRARLSPDARGFIGSPTVLVGENGGEYVIPSEGLANPSIRSFIGAIESARVAGRLKNLKLEAVSPERAIGFVNGGYTYAASKASASTATTNDRFSDELLARLIERLSSPIEAKVSMLGPNGIAESTKKYNRMKSRGTL